MSQNKVRLTLPIIKQLQEEFGDAWQQGSKIVLTKVDLEDFGYYAHFRDEGDATLFALKYVKH